MSRAHIRTSRVLSLLFLLLVSSCRREPLYEEGSAYRLDINIDYSMLYGSPRKPELMSVVFFDPQTGNRVGQEFVGATGGFLYSLVPGNTYDIVIYNYDTETTNVVGLEHFSNIKAFTAVTSSGGNRIIAQPDHLFVDVLQSVYVPYIPADGSVYVFESRPKTILDTYRVIIDGVKGLQNAESVNVYLSGQASGRLLGPSALIHESAFVFFRGNPDYEAGEIRNTFNTFGKLPDESAHLVLNVIISGVDGATYVCREDVTEQFDDPENTAHIIHATFDITVQPRQEGGFEPTVDQWDTEHEEWLIQ